jgi:hypothetical protein
MVASASWFARTTPGVDGVHVITPCEGLQSPSRRVGVPQLRLYAKVDIASADRRYRDPLARDARSMRERLETLGAWEVVLLGSVASNKYVDVLTEVFGDRLLFPADFVGRGDMSRGGLLLRCVREGRELEYRRLSGAARRGPRPPRLTPVPGILRDATPAGPTSPEGPA